MPAQKKYTEDFKLRISTKLREKLDQFAGKLHFKNSNQLALSLIETAVELAENSSSCPPVPEMLAKLRLSLHGPGSGTYFDEQKTVCVKIKESDPATLMGSTVVENMESDRLLMRLIDELANARAEASVLRLRQKDNSNKESGVKSA